MRKLISHLKKWRELSLSDILTIPEPIPNCYVCGEPEHIYHVFHGTSGLVRIGVCLDCYTLLDECGYCETRQLIVSNGMCKHCATNSAQIRSYGYKPDPLFHRVNNSRTDKPPLLTPYGYARCTKTGDNVPVVHYGHELECDGHHSGNPRPIDSGSTIASVINCIGKGSTGKENLLYTKEDGTCLLEIVSNPMSWNYWNMYGKEIFQTLFPKMLENNLYGYSAPDSGHHIHVSRNAINKIDIMKIMSFVYNPENYDFILAISQREPSRLEEWASPVLTDGAWENLSRISRWRSISRDYVNVRRLQKWRRFEELPFLCKKEQERL
jgi:hypothetical protein